MSYALAIPNSAFKLQTRNELASKIIARYAERHRFMDVFIGAAGLLIPGGGIIAMIATMAAQAPAVYQPMVKELAQVYGTSPDSVTRGMVTDATLTGAFADMGNELASEFGQEFLLELIQELWPELGFGAAIGFIPVVGAIAAATLDATFAATLTWEVGVMVAMYFIIGVNMKCHFIGIESLFVSTQLTKDIAFVNIIRSIEIKHLLIST
jgi:uncharacterized protein (DUF697 family)